MSGNDRAQNESAEAPIGAYPAPVPWFRSGRWPLPTEAEPETLTRRAPGETPRAGRKACGDPPGALRNSIASHDFHRPPRREGPHQGLTDLGGVEGIGCTR